jgi:flagellar motor switch protein FliG
MANPIQQLPQALASLSRIAGWSERERQQHAPELRDFFERLARVSRGARKLLTLIAEQAPTEQEHEALMPRLHEACGLDPEEMDRYLHELQSASLIRIDGQYPFEQIAPTAETSGIVPMDLIAKTAKQKNVVLRDAIGELELGFLD